MAGTGEMPGSSAEATAETRRRMGPEGLRTGRAGMESPSEVEGDPALLETEATAETQPLSEEQAEPEGWEEQVTPAAVQAALHPRVEMAATGGTAPQPEEMAEMEEAAAPLR